MNFKRNCALNLPQLLWGGLSENWLLKELGDVHWQQITNALEQPSSSIVNQDGSRLYASFTRLSWSGSDLTTFKENELLRMESELSYYKDKMFFSETICTGDTGQINATLMSVFSTKNSSDNKALTIGGTGRNLEQQGVRSYPQLPPFVKEYLKVKSSVSDKKTDTKQALYTATHLIDPYEDINGVGLLYFANYSKISDRYERHYVQDTYQLEGDWFEVAGIIARDIHYYGNANAGEKLIYELDELSQDNGKIHTVSSLYRMDDGQLIAKIFTTKSLKEETILERKNNSLHSNKPSPLLNKPLNKKLQPQIITVKTIDTVQQQQQSASVIMPRNTTYFNEIVIPFLQSILDIDQLHPQDNLSELGVASIIYTELSGHLLNEHGIESNPSRFYAATTINDLSAYLAEIAPVLPTEIIPQENKEIIPPLDISLAPSSIAPIIVLVDGSATLADKLADALEVEVILLNEVTIKDSYDKLNKIVQKIPATAEKGALLFAHSEKEQEFVADLLRVVQLNHRHLMGQAVELKNLSIRDISTHLTVIETAQEKLIKEIATNKTPQSTNLKTNCKGQTNCNRRTNCKGQNKPCQTSRGQRERSVAPAPLPIAATEPRSQTSNEPIAIIGMSGRMPGSPDLKSYWENLVANKDLVTEVPAERWDWKAYYGDSKKNKRKLKVKWGGFIKDADKFDPLHFNISPREAELMDPQHRIALEAVYHALEDAAINPQNLSGTNTGIFIGSYTDDYATLIRLGGLEAEAQAATGLSQALIANRISYLLDIHGPSETIDTACSSSLIAVHRAIQNIRLGHCDLVIVGGVCLNLIPDTYFPLHQAGFLSKEGRCKTFDQSANGYVRSEGVGMIVLKPLSQAEADGDQIHAIIRGSAENHGGKANTLTSPNPNAQRDLLLQAYRSGNIDPRTVSYIEAHGTGTALGDPIETEGLKSAFRALYAQHNLAQPTRPHIKLGSVKANIGHLEPAAGIAGLLKVVQALKHQVLPGNPQLNTPNEYLELANSPFQLQKETTIWESSTNQPRVAGVSSFGFGGVNAHVVLEEYQPVIRKYQAKEAAIILLSAKNKERLKEQVLNLSNYLVANPSANLYDIAYTLQVGRAVLQERIAFVVNSLEELASELANYQAEKIKGFFQGNTKKDKNDFLLESGAGRAYIDYALAHYESKSLAQLWVKGVPIDWQLLYATDNRPNKISLPVYPFVRKSYWVSPQKTTATDKLLMGGAALHPLVQSNESDAYSIQYASAFTGKEFFFEEHVINGEKILPGVAYLEMVLEAGRRALGQTISTISDVIWLAPMAIDQIEGKIYIRLQPENDYFKFEIVTGENTLFCTGRLMSVEVQQPAKRPIQQLLADCSSTMDGAAFEQLMIETGFAYGPSFLNSQTLHYNDSYSILSLKKADKSADGFYFHPAYFDTLIRTYFGFQMTEQEQVVRIPFSLNNFILYGNPADIMYSLCWEHENNTAGAAVQHYNYDFLDEAGQIIAQLIDFSPRATKPLKTKVAKGKSAHQAIYLQSLWEEKESAAVQKTIDQQILVLPNCASDVNAYFEQQFSGEVLTWEDAPDANTLFHQLFSKIKVLKEAKKAGNIYLLIEQRDWKDYAFIAGLFRALTLDAPFLKGKVIGVEELSISTKEQVLSYLQQEQDNKDIEIAYVNNTRTTRTFKLLQQSSIVPSSIMPKTCLITGGMGAIGQIFANYVAEEWNCQTILLGRSSLSEEKRNILQTIKGAVYMQCDLADKASLAIVLDKIRSTYGAINGLIHCAGVLGDSDEATKDKSSINTVLNPKVIGTDNLDALTQQDDLQFFVMTSSVSANLNGMAGLKSADYAAANAYLDAFASHRNELVAKGERKGLSRSIIYPHWKTGGMDVGTNSIKWMKDQFGMQSIAADLGMEAFSQSLSQPADQLLVLFGDKQKMLTVFFPELLAKPTKQAQAPIVAGDLNSKVTAYLKASICEIIKVPVEEMDETLEFMDYGIDSIVAIEIINYFEKDFGTLPKTLLFEFADLEELSTYFCEKHSAKAQSLWQDQEASTTQPVIEEQPAIAAPKSFVPRLSRVAASPPPSKSPPITIPEEVAIVGIAGLFPNATDPEALWENIISGQLLNEGKEQAGTFWNGISQEETIVDFSKHPIFEKEKDTFNRQERLVFGVFCQAMDRMGLQAKSIRGTKTGVFLGLQQDFAPKETGNGLAYLIPNKLSFLLNLKGPSEMVNTYCSSVYVAVHRAIQSIKNGECEQAIVGGANIINPSYATYEFGSNQTFDILSANHTTKSFDEKANGFVRSEGAGILLLKPLKKAEADGDNILGIIKGSYVHHGGKNLAFEAPSAKGIKETIKGCLSASNINADTIDYIEAHGIANPTADAIELSAIDAAYQKESSIANKKWLISTIKPTVGHSELASGMASLIKVLKAFEHKNIPGIPGLEQVNGELNPDHSLVLGQTASYWENGKHPRRAALNGYSVGGVNAHLILEEYPSPVKEEKKPTSPTNKQLGIKITAPAAVTTPIKAPQSARAQIISFVHNIFDLKESELDLELSPIDYDFDSIKITQFVRRLNQHFGIEVKLGQLLSVDDFESMFVLFEKAIAQKKEKGIVKEKKEPAISTKHYPLSEGQKGLWFIQEANKQDTAYNVPVALELAGTIDPELIYQVAEKLLIKHPILQATFGIDTASGALYQEISTEQQPLKRDIQTLAEGQDINTVFQQLIRHPFDLSQEVLRLYVRTHPTTQKTYLLFVIHHIVFDGTSVSHLGVEFIDLMEQMGAGHSSLSLSPDHTFFDYIAWETDYIKSADGIADVSYWKERLQGNLEKVKLPQELTDPIGSEVKAIATKRLDGAILEGLKAAAKSHRVSLSVFLLAVFKVLLHRLSGSEEIIVKVPTAGRPEEKYEDSIGYYINIMLSRLAISGEDTFANLVQTLRTEFIGSIDYLRYPYPKLLSELQLTKGERDAQFAITFNFINIFSEVLAGDNEAKTMLLDKVHQEITDEYILEIVDFKGELRLQLKYRADLFSSAAIQRHLDYFQNILSAVLAKPDTRIAKIDMVGATEKQQLLQQFNDTAANYPVDKTIVQLFEEQVAKTPNNIAVAYEGRVFSYQALNEKANGVAQHLLTAYNIQANDIIGLQVSRSEWMLVGILGILKAGAAYLPMGPDMPKSRVAFMLEDSAAKLLLTDKNSQETSQMFADIVPVLTVEELANTRANGRLSKVNHQASNLAYIIYTSGSTGKPKGVMIEHRNVVRLMVNDRPLFDFNEKDVWTLFHYYGFDFSVWEIWGALLFGGKVVVVSKQATLNPEAFADLLVAEQVTVLNQVPSTFDQVQVHLLNKASDTIAIRYIIFGGAKLIPSTLREWKNRFPATQLINMYGITETTVHVTYKEIDEAAIEAGISNVGKPIPTLRCYILDETLSPSPIGVVGEIYVAGDGLARGYLNNPGLTNERFIDNPFEPGQKLYKAGDSGRWLANGDIEFFGRIDFQLKIRGFRIEAGEIEQLLLAHPAIQSTIVLGKEINGTPELVAYLTGDEETMPSLENLRAYLSEDLPAYMVPAYFVQMEAFPLTKNGKIDRKALPEPSGLSLSSTVEFIAPRNEVEEKIATAFADILGVAATTISIQDDFFNLGGDSIKLIRLVGRIHRELAVKISLAKIYASSRVVDLANYISQNTQVLEAEQSQDKELQQALEVQFATLQKTVLATEKDDSIETVFPMSDIQKGMVFGHLLYENEGVYHDQAIYDLESIGFEQARFEQAVALMIAKHTTLRTAFRLNYQGENIQLVYKNIVPPISYHATESSQQDEVELMIATYLKEERQKGFNIEKAGLWRMRIFQAKTKQPLLVFQFHHAIFDGWSLASFNTELLTIYHQLAANPAYEPAPFQLSYRDFVIRELITKQEKPIRDFWQQELEDYERADLFTEEKVDDEFEINIGKLYLKQLQEVAAQQDTSVKNIALAGYLLLLDFLSYQSESVIGIISTNRLLEEEGDQLLGCFLNSVPFRVPVDKQKNIADFIQQVAEKTKSLRGKDQLTTMEIARLIGETSVEGNPIFDVIFNYIDFHVYDKLEAIGMETTNMLQAELNSLPAFFERTNTFFDLMVNTTGDELTVKVQLSKKLKAGYSAKEVLYKYIALLDILKEQPSTKIGAIDLLTGQERQQLLTTFNPSTFKGAASYSTEKTIIDLFEAQAAKTPNRTALVFDGTAMTYEELEKRSRQLAIYLRQEGVQTDTLVGLCMNRSLEMMVAILGILRAGGAYVPLDPEYPKDRVVYMLEDGIIKGNQEGVAKIIITQEPLKSLVTDNIDDLAIQLIALSDDWSANEAVASIEGILDNRPSPEDLIYVIFTSGSTGKPKGTLVKHQGFYNLMHWYLHDFDFHEESKFLLVSSINFDLTQKNLYAPLLLGGSLHMSSAEHYDVTTITDIIKAESITNINCTPSIFYGYVEAAINKQFKSLQSLEYVFLGGEPINLAKLDAWFNNPLNISKLVNSYGPTECSDVVSDYTIEDSRITTIPIGKPICNTQLYVLDAQQNLVPIGVQGELCIGGKGIGRGYLNNPIMTNEKFIANPFKTGELLYKTGDIARMLPDGNIEFLGRADHQLKIRGHRIEAGEIEEVLQKHTAIHSAVVMGKEIGDNKELVAYLVPSETTLPTIEVLRTYLMERLPDYMVPAYFVELEKLPLTPSGKVNRRALPEPTTNSLAASSTYIAPRTRTETILSKIWEQVLQQPKVGIHDNFFHLGGHSLRAVQLVGLIQQELSVAIKLSEIFAAPTVAALASQLVDRQEQQYAAIQTIASQAHYALSNAQRRLWLSNQLEDNQIVYNMPMALRFKGTLNQQALRVAFERLVDRHESLRTNIITIDGHPRQLIHPVGQFELSILQWKKNSATTLSDYILNFAQQPFDLAKDALIRLELLQLNTVEHLLLFNMHHIAFDGWSMQILLKELSYFYEAYLQDSKQTLPALSIQYKDYAAWQNALLGDTVLMGTLQQYWLQKLAPTEEGFPVLALPTDYPRPAVQTFEGTVFTKQFDKKLLEGLEAISQTAGVTLSMTLTALVKVLLYRYSSQRDILVGIPSAGRVHADLEQQLGFYVNMLVLRDYVEEGISFVDFLKSVGQTSLEAMEHELYPFDRLVEDLNIPRDLSRSPLFDVLVVFQDHDPSQLHFGDLDIVLETIDWEVSKFDLSFGFISSQEGLRINIEYNTNLFKATRIERMFDHLECLMESILTDAQQAVDQLNLLPAKEHTLLVENFGIASADYDFEKTIHQLFEEQVVRTPNNIALIFEETELTYQDLNEKANQLAHYLINYFAIQKDDIIALQVERSEWMLIALLGIMKSGGAYLPLAPDYPANRTAYMLQDSKARLLVTDATTKEAAQTAFKDILPVIAIENSQHDNRENPITKVTPRNLAYIIYTSGSTGQPKGVLLEHRGVANMLLSQVADLAVTEADSTLQFAPYTFDASVGELFMGFCAGATMVIASRETLLSTEAFKELMHRHQITIADMPPTYLAVLDKAALAKARLLITAGEAAISKDVKKYSSQLQYVNIYGPTENSVVSSSFKIPASYEIGQSVPIGRPIANSSILILDKQLQLVPVGVPGEIVLGGAGLARGYLNNAALTEAKFIAHPFQQGERLYRTGDLGRWLEDGNIEFLGRVDHQLKIRGHRIEAGEIEDRLLQHPTIQAAVVLGKAINGTKELIAYLVANNEASLNVADLRAHLEEDLPTYMIPAYFVQLATLPLTSHDKVNRKALPLPDSTNILASSNYAAPTTAMEKLLVQVWEEVLRQPSIGINDNFFHIGGDSIKALQISGRLGARGFSLPIKELFLQPTIAQVATSIKTKKQQYPQELLSGELPMTAIQQWFFETIKTDTHHFNQAFILSSQDSLDTAILEQSLVAIIKHHDLLRATYPLEEGNIIQTIHPESPLDFQIVNLKETTQASAVIEKYANETQASFDLTKGPLVKAVLFKKESQDELLLVIHHLVVDGVSWRIILEDLTTAYQQLATAKSVKLPPKTAPFTWWSKQISDYANSEASLQHQAYWSQVLNQSVDQLIIDYPEQPNTVGDSATVSVQLNPKETQSLLKATNKAYNTEINDVLLCALSRALQQTFGGTSYQITLEGHGREALFDMDISRTVGWFTSMFPVVLTYKEEIAIHLPSTKEDLHRIPNKGMDYVLLRYLTDVDMGAAMQSKISFNYLGAFSENEEDGLLNFSNQAVGASSSPSLERDTELDINGLLIDGQLQLSISYGSQRMKQATVESFALTFKKELLHLIKHCTAQTRSQLTPVDFTACDLNLAQYHSFLQANQLRVENIADIYNLSPLQEGMLFHKLMDTDAPAYFNQVELTIATAIDIPYFKKCWEQILQAHPVLRTSFHTEGLPRPLQVVHKQTSLHFVSTDLRTHAVEEQEQIIQDYILSDRAKGFDLSKPSLLRLALFQTDAAQFRLVVSDHHITMDGWSQAILLQDLKRLYRKDIRLLTVKPFSPYIAWLNEQSESKSAAFWQDYLKGYEETAAVPKLKTTTATTAMDSQTEALTISEAETSALEALAKANQVSLNTVVQGIWSVVLGIYNQQIPSGKEAIGEVVFGMTTSGRSAPIKDIETLSGLFINTIPLRVTWSEQDSFTDLLGNIQRSALAVQEYEHSSLAHIQKVWQGQGELIDHIIAFENYPEAEQVEGEGQLDIRHTSGYEPIHYDFGLVVGIGKELQIHLNYNQATVSSDWVKYIKGHILTTIHAIIEHPEQLVTQIGIIPATETQLLLHDFNDTQADFPKDKTIIDLFEEQVAKTPDSIAVVFGNTELTYKQLNEQANKVGHYLRKTYSIQADDIIALQLERSEWMIIAIFGIMKAGAAYLPIAPDTPKTRVEYMLEDAQSKVLITDQQTYATVQTLETATAIETIEKIKSRKKTNLKLVCNPRSLAYIIYTSGSTGKPKGVMIEHQGIVNRLHWMQKAYPIGQGDCILQKTPYTFDVSVWELLWWALQGATVAMLTPGAEKEPAKIIEAIARHQVSTMHFVPSMLAAFLGYIQKAPLQEETKSLRQVFASGEALGLVQVQQFFGHINNPTTALHNLYGPTEASIDVSYFDCHTLGNRNMVPIGQPIDNIQLHIINEQKELTPLGIAGELCISGVGLSRGYLNNPELTAEKFIPHPFKEGERLYKTGDLARWLPDGNIEFLGRIDFQLKIRGYRIEAGEIEQALLSHPSIHHCTVVGKTINKDTELVAYIVAKEAMDLPDVVQLRNFLKEGLPSYMIPSHFVELAEMPLTTSGKVNRKALPAPDASGLATGTNYMAPRNDMEQQLVTIWEEILGRKMISITDNFFDLGGHSLKAIRLLGQIQEQLKLQFPLQLLFQHPVLSEQAAQLQLLSQHENTTTYQEGVRFNPTAEQTVFTFPPFFGLSAWYQQLANQLSDVSFYCFDFLLEANRLEVYYEQIKKQQATGPYVLFGYSAGGSLAYEMAAYMEAQGDVVAAVVMGDSMIVSNMKTDLEGYLNDLSTALSTRQDDSAKGLLELIQHPTLRAQSKQRLAAYESFLNQVGNLAIQADIHLIKAEFEASIATMHQRWNEYTKGDYNEYQASGSHDYLFEAPNLQANGAMLRGIFEKSLVKEIK